MPNTDPQGRRFSGSRHSNDASNHVNTFDPFREFTAFVHRKQCQGTDGFDRTKPYILHGDLATYWARVEIREVFNSIVPPISCSIENILSRYLRSFSLLVYLNMVQHLPIFVQLEITDDYLGWHPLLAEFDCLLYEELQRKVQEYKWRFFPLIIQPAGPGRLSNTKLSDHVILPINSAEVLKRSDSSIVKKVTVQLSHDPNREVTYIIKTYMPGYISRYNNEIRALETVASLKNDNLPGYYGSFAQSNGYSLVLQYVDGGNLADYFMTTPTPKTPDEIHRFWRSICNVWRGLDGLHRLVPSDGAGMAYLGVHGDLKPDNILISKTGGDYDFVPIISDFGHSHVKSVPEGGTDRTVPDRHGNHDFAAPEASHHASHRINGPFKITTEADIWSMGCILTVAAAWVLSGKKGIDIYGSLRKIEVSPLPNFNDEGHYGCFHNGTERLVAVERMHDTIAGFRGDSGGPLTRDVIKVLLEKCIVGEWKSRKTANHLYETLCNTIGHQPFERNPEPTPPSSNHNQSGPPSQGKATSRHSNEPRGDEHITIQQCHQWVDAKKNSGQVDQIVERQISRLQEQFKGREQVFMIDDTPDMSTHKKELRKALRTLTYIVKSMDPNRVELIFASHPEVTYRPTLIRKSSQPLLDAFDKCQFRNIHGSMEYSLELVIDSIIKHQLHPRKPPISLYIFTDGRWGSDRSGACGVEIPIRKLVDATRKFQSRTKTMVQFIRFGDDPNGLRHLQFLDTFGAEEQWDIVDHKPITGNVFAMIPGSIIPKADLEGEETHEQDPESHSSFNR
ncbi:hypothetical protein QQS21_005796 [Conoideocrella luteorostrata]|uniref:Protein kinase domain-containing protein n=1 Tax=Conoideocrella luteorostrata TaxID=1105319 RepID=A0AAJ0FTI1_9HYPO|nr:hypothetical protein QQS21_005796 [Conoideocrella luteorostrata]